MSYKLKAHAGRASQKVECKGVAITLKGFLGELDELHTQHDTEKEIRRQLRGHPRCETRMKQYFNVVGSTRDRPKRCNKCSMHHLVPFDEFPQEAFDVLQEGLVGEDEPEGKPTG